MSGWNTGNNWILYQRKYGLQLLQTQCNNLIQLLALVQQTQKKLFRIDGKLNLKVLTTVLEKEYQSNTMNFSAKNKPGKH